MRLGLYGGALFLGVPLAFAFVMTRGFPNPGGTPPRDYEELRLVSRDGLKLRAWLARGSPDRSAAVVIHGLGDSLESYQEHARLLRSRGHTVLLVDLRAHGGSEGNLTTLGGLEQEDVRAGMRTLREHRLAGRGLLLLGHSIGAVAGLLAAAGEPDLRAVVVEAPFDSYRATIAHHAWLLYKIPSWAPIIPIAIAMAEWRAGFDADAVDCVAAARRIRAPLLAIVDGIDPRMPEAVVRRIVDAHPGPKRLWVCPGADHVQAIFHPDYWKHVGGFLEENGL